MEMRKKITGTYVLLIIITAGMVSAGVMGCNAIVSSLDDTEEPARNNENDPNNPDAEPPRAQITSHDNSVLNEVTVQSPAISWEPDPAGITVGVEYQYRLAFPGQNIENISWFPTDSWTTETSTTLPFLDESFNPSTEIYTFQVRARAIENTSKMQQTPTELNFFVNAIGDHGIVFDSRVLGTGSNFSTEIALDEIEAADDLSAVQVDIAFNSNRFAVDTSQVEIYTGQGFFTQSGGQIIGLKKVTQVDSTGTVSLSIGFVNSGGGLSSVSGSGAIARVTFQPLDQNPFQQVIQIQNSSRFKRSDGSDLLISNGDFDRAVLFRN